MATGRDWLSFKTRPAKVLIVDAESGHERLRQRLHEVANGALIRTDIPVVWLPPTNPRLCLSVADDQYALLDLIEREQAELVIVDSLGAVTSRGRFLSRPLIPSTLP